MDEATESVLYTVRSPRDSFTPRVYTQGSFTVRVGRNRPEGTELTGLIPARKAARVINVKL